VPFTWLMIALWATYCLAFMVSSFLMSPVDWGRFPRGARAGHA
jgi:hypothetical protein